MDEDTLPIAQRALSEAFGASLRLEPADDRFSGSDRSHVSRFQVLNAPLGTPASVIVKRVVLGEGETYELGPSGPSSPAWRLFNDWAGLQFLTTVAGNHPVAPRLLAGDREAGLIVIEDLGAGDQTSSILLGADPERASERLLEYAALLGRMHALTTGRRREFEALRDSLAPRIVDPERASYEWLADSFRQTCSDLEIEPAPGADADVAQVIDAIRDPGPFLAYTHGDPCPDNDLRSDRLRLLDFEFGDFRHALVDGVYPRMIFPTCWCVGQTPPPMLAQMEDAYRAELVRGCPEAQDDARWRRALATGCAYWALVMCDWYKAPRLLAEDYRWGRATIRQRVLLRTKIFARTTDELGQFKALGATFEAIGAKLRALLPETEEIGVYPAFE